MQDNFRFPEGPIYEVLIPENPSHKLNFDSSVFNVAVRIRRLP